VVCSWHGVASRVYSIRGTVLVAVCGLCRRSRQQTGDMMSMQTPANRTRSSTAAMMTPLITPKFDPRSVFDHLYCAGWLDCYLAFLHLMQAYHFLEELKSESYP